MRTRKEINDELVYCNFSEDSYRSANLEVLLDIRDLLMKEEHNLAED